MTPLNLDPNQNYLTPYTPPVDVPEWRKSLGSFAKETSALGSGLVALGAQTLGLEEAQDNALADYQRSMQEAGSGWMTPEVGQIEDIKLTESGGLGRLGSYLGYQVPKGIAQLGSLVVGGLGTGAVAKAVASKGIKELAKAEMKNLAADVAAKGAAGMVAKQVATPLVERAAGQEAIKQLAKRQVLGTQVGVGAGALGMETGQMYGKLATDPEVGPDKATAPAVLYGGVAAALEYLPLHMAGQALGLDRLLLRKVIKADPVLAQQAANLNLAQKAAKLGGKALKGAAAGAAVEGITEGMQNLVEQAATKYAQEDSQWASVLPTTKEGWSDFWNNVAAGAAVGGVAGAALGPMARTQQRPTGEVSEQEPEATRGPAAEAGAPIRVPLPGGQAPAEAPAPAPGAATAEGIADVLSMPGGPEAGAAALGQGAAATPATPTAEQPPSEPAGGEVQGAVAPQGGGMVVDTTSPQQAPIIPEVPRAQQDASPAALYENVPSPEQQGGQEVQLPAEEGGERVLPGGQEVKEVIGKADGTPFASRDAATRRLNQLWAQGGMQIQEGPEAGKQARTRVAKQGDGYVIERLESRTEPQVLDTDSTGKLVHPTPEGRANFKEWFTGSKVVDGEGRPLRVYRGDKDSSFTEFNVESLGQNTKTLGSKLGFFFTPNYDFAAAPQFGGNIRSFYLGAKKPYLVPVVDGQLEADARIQGYKEFNVDSEELLRKKLVDAGYDSIMYAGYPSNQQAELIALDPTVIKSIRNRGTYEQGNPNILESRATAPVHSTIDFVAATDAVLGQGWTQRAIDAGILQVNETSAAGSASGYFDKGTGRLTINLDRTPQGFSVADVVLHEGSHSGLARMLGGQFNSFHQDLQKLADRGSATARLAILQATQGAISAINRQRTALGAEPFPHRIGDETLPAAERTAELKRVRALIDEQNPGLLPEEDLAYYVQLASSARPAEVGFWRRLQTAIQAWFAGTDFGKAMAALGWRPELSPQLAVSLATRAAQQTLQRAELVNRLVGERSRVLRGLPVGAWLGVMESAVWHAGPNPWGPEPGFPRGRPRLDKVGTGEGGQLFGWGWYSAENEAVSGPEGQYAKTFSKQTQDKVLLDGTPIGNLSERAIDGTPAQLDAYFAGLIAQENGKDGALAWLDFQIADQTKNAGRNRELLDWVNTLRSTRQKLLTFDANRVKVEKGTAFVARLNIPDADIQRMIQWEKPLSEQTEEVRGALEKIRAQFDNGEYSSTLAAFRSDAPASRLYASLESSLPPVHGEHPKKKVSEYLRSLGIVGNKYLDYGSRPGTSGPVALLDSTGEVVKTSNVLEDQALGDLRATKGDYAKAIEWNSDLPEVQSKLRKWQEAGYKLQREGQTFNYVIWNQDVLDRVGMQHLDWQTGEVLESRGSTISPSWWRSGVATAVASAPQQKAAPQQWLGWLKNQPGVKQEEIEDLGLEDWLLAQEGSVQKADVERFVRDGGVRIEEVQKGGPESVVGGFQIAEIGGPAFGSPYATREEAEAELADIFPGRDDLEIRAGSPFGKQTEPTKFTTYQVPGGENYRELLITVPQQGGNPATVAQELRAQIRDAEEAGDNTLARQLDAQLVQLENIEESKDYRGPHWSEPNVLVHIRFNERTGVDGKRVLFVEEVQSDWHQEGRKKGYSAANQFRSSADIMAAAEAELQALDARRGALTIEERERRSNLYSFVETLQGPLAAEYRAAQAREREIQLPTDAAAAATAAGLGVPNAPLKSAWPLLGMKRAIRWAAEHGFDSVAWTPGSVQAERYDLSKQVDHIAYAKNANGTYEFEAVDKLGNVIINKEEATRAEVEDTVGKEIADKMDADAGVTVAQYTTRSSQPLDEIFTRVLENVDLRVGGEGMRGFYDKMLPSMLNKYGKKFGAKVGETEIRTERGTADLAVTRVWFGADGDWHVYFEGGTEVSVYGPDAKDDAEAIDQARELTIAKTQPVWSLPITPALRDEALAGQLLYSLPPMSTWELPHSWFTSPVSTYPEDFNTPGTFNKVFHGMVDRFNYVKEKSPELYRAFDEWKNRQGALQQEIQRTYLDPLRHWVSRYQPPPSDSEPIRRTEIEAGKVSDPNQKYTTVEIVGHQLAARHILLDNVTEQLALKASPAFLKELKKQLSPTNVGLLNADIKLETGGSLAIAKLTNDQARMLFERYLPSADPKSDIGLRWTLYNRRSAGYSIATPGSIEAIDDAKEGFINAHELYTPQVAGRETFQKIAELSDKLAAHQLAMLQEGGLLEQADVNRLSRAYPHFVPLRREAFDYDRELADMFEKPRANIGKLMTRDGSTEFASAVHVLQNHLAAGFTAASAAARNQMMNKFYDVLNADRQGWKPWFRISEKRDNNGAMGLIRNGKTLYLVPADGNIRAASIARVITGRDAEQLSGPFKVMRSINNWIRWSNVSASPAFMLANTPRDYLTAVYNLQASEAAQYVKEIASWTNYKESFKALKKVIVDGVRETTNPEVQSWIDLVEDFEKSGGKTSFVEALRAMDGDSWRSFEAQVGRREGKKGAVVEYGREKLEWLENLNITLENVMRLSTYKVMRDKVGKERAAEIARNLTTNFTRRGAHIDAINTWWLFYNATVQGNWQVVQNLFLNPNKAGQRRLQKAVAGTILFAFMIDQLGRAFSDDEDDDGISDWDSRPGYEKERKISSPFKVGGVYPSIPAPWVFNIFWRMGGMLGEVKDGVLKPQDAVLDSIALTASAMDPVGGLRALGGEGTMAQAISPSAFDPFMQMIENRDFMGNPLGPDGYPGASKRPDAYLAWDSTPKGFKTVAQFVNDVTGGSAVESGKVDLRPSSYKVMADFLLGGLGRFGADVGEGLGILPGDHFLEREGLKDVPGAKVFLSAPSDSTAISLYHDRVAQVLGSERLVKFYSEGPEKNPQKLAQVQQDRAALLRMVPQVDDTERQIKSLRKTLRSAQARGDSRTEEQLRDRIVQLQKRFNSSYSRRIGN